MKKLAFLPCLLLFILGLSYSTDAVGSIADLNVFKRAVRFVYSNYVDPVQVDARRMLDGSLREIAKTVPPFLYTLHDTKLEYSLGNFKGEIRLNKNLRVHDLSSVLSNVFNFLSIHSQVGWEQGKWEHFAIEGAIEAFDRHSTFLSPKVFNELKVGTKGNFGGLGFVVGVRDGVLTVITPLEDTPAWKAGIKPKDQIVQIDGSSTINMPLTQAVEKLRGKVGSPVSIVVRRAGEAVPISFVLVRALIKIKGQNAELFDKENRIGLLKIKNFQEDTASEMDRHLEILSEMAGPEGLAGLILDLRNNPGGLLDQAVAVADRFLSQGVIVTTVGAGDKREDREYASAGDAYERLPLVVLINGGSASASEIVAGALKNLDRAVLLGDLTFGKGTVQTIYDLRDGSGLKLTIAKYLSSGNIPVHNVGIMPDISLEEVTISQTGTDLIENERIKDDAELVGGKLFSVSLSEPIFKLRYFESESFEVNDEDAGKIKLREDLPVKIASQILVASPTFSRQHQIKAAIPILKNARSEEEEKIVQKLKEVDVDWARKAVVQLPAAKVSFTLLDEDKKPVQSLLPGQKSSLKLTVYNKGREPFYQLIGVMKSQDPFFMNYEFPFGRINSKESKSWILPITIPEYLVPREVPVKISFLEGNKHVPDTYKTEIKIQDPEPPLFSFKVQSFENGRYDSIGNGDGIIQKGERISVLVSVKNEGAGTSEKPIVTIHNSDKTHVYIEKGRDELAALKPNQEKIALLHFHWDERFEMEEFAMELEVVDGVSGQGFGKKLSYSPGIVSKTNKGTAAFIPPKIQLDRMPLQSRSGKILLNGSVSDDHKVDHMLIFVDEDKVSYIHGASNNIRFSEKIPLKKGRNLLTLIAKDADELVSRKQWVVWKK